MILDIEQNTHTQNIRPFSQQTIWKKQSCDGNHGSILCWRGVPVSLVNERAGTTPEPWNELTWMEYSCQ